MKVLRRSLHKDKDRISSPSRASFGNSASQPTQPFASLAPSNPNNLRSIGGPPMMVIRATANYKALRIVELSFQKGDFFHVVGERVDQEGAWFEASNPATGARGIVPKHAFELFGKKQNQSPQLQSANSIPRIPQVPSQPRASAPAQSASRSPVPARTPTSAEPPRSAGSKSQPLYGIVQHDFVAERPDELDAKRGEPIIVIAQSNHEWFVAKPIGRLGGPGLIPVSFVEVQDVTTGRPLGPQQVKELIRSAVVPKVEEWKKATAAYKGNSIPLGKFDFAAAPPPPPAGPSQPLPPLPSHPNGHGHARQQSDHHPPSMGGGSWHSSAREQQQPRSRQGSADTRASPYPVAGWEAQTGYPPRPDERGYDEERLSEAELEGDGYATVDELRERYGVVVHASVESFHYEQGHFWFHLRAHFSRPVGVAGAEETTVLVLYRLYEDFFDFQTALLEAFPSEAGSERLPRMPGPTEHVDELVCAQRVEELSEYLHALCGLALYIRECELVYEFLGPREGDVELEGDPGGAAQTDAEGEVVEYLERMDQRQHGDGQLDELNASIARLSSGAPAHQRDASQGSQHSRGYAEHGQQAGNGRRPFSGLTASTQKSSSPPYHLSTSSEGVPSTLPSAHTSASSGHPLRAMGSQSSVAAQNGPPGGHQQHVHQIGGPPGGFLRIKIYQRATDDLIALRVPLGIGFHDLLQRIRDRVGPEVKGVRYREEGGGGDSNNGKLVAIVGDEGLERWLGSGGKLVLYVD